MKRLSITRKAVACVLALGLSAPSHSAQLAYLALTDGYWEAWTSDDSGANARAVSAFHADVSRVSWFPDGKRLLINRHDGRWFTAQLDGEDLQELAPPMPGIVDGVLSPDGKSIAFSLSTGGSIDDNDIWLFDIASKRLRKLTQMPRLQHEPAWSPDGRFVYFLSGDGGQAHDIWRVDVASSATEQLTVNDLYHFDLSIRDSGALLYSSNRTGDYEIWMQQPPAEPVQLTDHRGLDARPTWSPDGKQLAFESTRDGDVAIYRLDIESREPVRVSAKDQPARAPVWFSAAGDTP